MYSIQTTFLTPAVPTTTTPRVTHELLQTLLNFAKIKPCCVNDDAQFYCINPASNDSPTIKTNLI
jgi:hypothetical protein